MLKWTASTQRLHELPMAPESRVGRRPRRQRRATIANSNKENVPGVGCTSTPMPLARLRNSPLVLAPLSDIRNVTPEAQPPATAATSSRRAVQSVRYAATLPRYEVEYSPSAGGALPSGQHLALRGLLPLDPFLEQPRYMAGAQQLRQRRLEAEFVATMEQPTQEEPKPEREREREQPAIRAVTPQPSTDMGDQTLDKLIDAILDSACKADASSKKKPRKSFNLRRRTLLKQQQREAERTPGGPSSGMLSPSYAPGDDPASDLSFGPLPLPLPPTPEPGSPLRQLPHSVLLQLPTPTPLPQPQPQSKPVSNLSDTFCLATPVRPLKRSRGRPAEQSPLKRYKVDARNYFEVGLALPSIYV